MRSIPLVRVAAATLLALSVAACDRGDARTEQIQPGMERAAVIAVLGSALPGEAAAVGADSLRNIWRSAQYFVDGRFIEVIWYSPSDEHRSAGDTVPSGRVMPVLLVDGKAVGVGRSTHDSLAKVFSLPRNRY